MRRVDALLTRISYKPNFKIQVYDNSSMHALVLLITATVSDSTPGIKEEIEIRAEYLLPNEKVKLMDSTEFVYFVQRSLLSFERHEFDEWFRVDGKPVTNAHPEEKTYIRTTPNG